MKEKRHESFSGLITMDRLFIGSKSEGVYPVLHTDSGTTYRLYFRGKAPLDEPTFSSFIGNEVTVTGVADDIRGHWRIVLHGEFPDDAIKVKSPVPTQINQVEE